MTRLLTYLDESLEKRAPKKILKKSQTSSTYEIKFLTHSDLEYTFVATKSYGEGTISFHHKGQMENLNLGTGTGIGGYIFSLYGSIFAGL